MSAKLNYEAAKEQQGIDKNSQLIDELAGSGVIKIWEGEQLYLVDSRLPEAFNSKAEFLYSMVADMGYEEYAQRLGLTVDEMLLEIIEAISTEDTDCYVDDVIDELYQVEVL